MAPFPTLTGGFIAKDADGAPVALAGELSPHGIVRHKGRTARFDSFVPAGLTLVLTEELDIAELNEVSRAALADLNVRTVTVADRRVADDGQFADTQGQFLPFMAERGIKAMLVRPDLYLFAGADTVSALEDAIAELKRQAGELGLSGRA